MKNSLALTLDIRLSIKYKKTQFHIVAHEWSMGFVGTPEIESLMPSSAMGILMNMLTDEAKSKPLSLGLSAFVSIYNQMRKSPYR